ncbi:22148_t:CDS:2, partial [Racocetra persica]
LPTTSYPVEGFTGLNDGVLLATLIHHKNSEWIEDFDELIKDDAPDDNIKDGAPDYNEEIIKRRLTRCFSILEDKLGMQKPKELISILIESDHKNKDRLRRTELMWNAYISDIFLAMSENSKRKNTMRSSMRNSVRNSMRNSMRLKHISENSENGNNKNENNENENNENENNQDENDENDVLSRSISINEQYDKEKGRQKSRGCIPSFGSSGNISPMPPWSPKASVITALFEWTIGWLLNDPESEDDSDFDKDDKQRDREMKTIKIGKRRSDGTWNIQKANEWKRKSESLSDNDDIPIQLLANSQSALHNMYWNS